MSQIKDWDRERVARWAQPPKRKGPSLNAVTARRIVNYTEQTSNSFTILDVGTGPAQLLIEIKKIAPGIKLIGIDPSIDMINIAKQNLEQSEFTDIEIKLGSAEEIPVDTETINLVVAQTSFLFWEDPRKGLSEVYRVLKPDGKILIADWNKSYPKWKFYLHNINIMRRAGMWRAKDVRRSFRKAYRFEEALQLIGEAGYRIVEAEGKELRFFIMAKRSDDV
ncbi:MAG: methyltransferase domain-containing protein [Dehalococcoidia bacterium]|nr:MAG: methyltransferase domain-containing protein [Dehalococcoidia bacterium]